MRTLRFLLRKEFLQIRRDRTLIRMIFIMPMLQMFVLAHAITFEVTSARLYVVDHDHTPSSRGVVRWLAASGRFVTTQSSPSTARATEAMLRREVEMILVVPKDFERDLVLTRSAPVQLILNAEDGVAAGVMLSYAQQILLGYSRELAAEIVPSLGTVDALPEPPPAPGQEHIELSRRGRFNSELEYRYYMVPAILVVLVTMIGTLLTSMNIVREKEAGTLDQLNVTPIPRWAFIAAKLIPLWAFAQVDLALGLLLGRFVLGVPVRGSLLLIFFAASVYLVGALGIGLWISTRAQTQQQAMFIAYALLMIYNLMSGQFTPLRAMPRWAQWVAAVNPVSHFTALMRAVQIKGAGWGEVASQLGALAVIGVVVMTLAVRQYSKTSA